MTVDGEGALPPELRAFIHSCIDSIAHVELLVMLHRFDRALTVREVASEMGASHAAARRDLETLAARGLLEVRVGEETSYRYRPKSEDLTRRCELLMQYYATARENVLGFVATESRLSIKRFADAFKLRDPDPER